MCLKCNKISPVILEFGGFISPYTNMKDYFKISPDKAPVS